MPNPILLKRNSTTEAIPAAGSLTAGELAVNTADGKVFTKLSNGWVVPVGPSFRSERPLYTGSATPFDLTANIGQVVRVTPAVYGSFSTATAIINLPTHAAAAIPIGAMYYLSQVGSGTVRVVPDSGVVLRAFDGDTLSGLAASAFLVKINTNTWTLTGQCVPNSNAGITTLGSILHITTANQIPSASQLETGQLAVNSADGVLYTKVAGGAIARMTFSLVGGSGSWTTTSTYTGSSTDIDLQNRINHKVSVTPGGFSPYSGTLAFIRIPLNSTAAISIGSRIWIEQVASATNGIGVDISPEFGVTANYPSGKKGTLAGLGALVMLEKTAVNTWSITGDLANV